MALDHSRRDLIDSGKCTYKGEINYMFSHLTRNFRTKWPIDFDVFFLFFRLLFPSVFLGKIRRYQSSGIRSTRLMFTDEQTCTPFSPLHLVVLNIQVIQLFRLCQIENQEPNKRKSRISHSKYSCISWRFI